MVVDKILEKLRFVQDVLVHNQLRLHKYFGERALSCINKVIEELEIAIQPAPRIYGRIHSAECTCPGCGSYMRFGSQTRRGKYKTRGGAWQARRHRLTCYRCQRSYIPALCLYRATKRVSGLPLDQVANDQERIEMAKVEAVELERAYFVPDSIETARPRTTNLVREDGCSCDPGLLRAGTDPRCIVHGTTT